MPRRAHHPMRTPSPCGDQCPAVDPRNGAGSGDHRAGHSPAAVDEGHFQHAHPAGKGAWPARRCPSRGLAGGRPGHRGDHRCAAGDDDITGGQLPDLGIRQPCHLGQHAEGADAAANPVVRRQLSATSERTWSRTISPLLPVEWLWEIEGSSGARSRTLRGVDRRSGRLDGWASSAIVSRCSFGTDSPWTLNPPRARPGGTRTGTPSSVTSTPSRGAHRRGDSR